MKTDARTLAKIETLYFEYAAEVNDSPLAPASRKTYINHVDQFVAWVKGEFEPGERLSRY